MFSLQLNSKKLKNYIIPNMGANSLLGHSDILVRLQFTFQVNSFILKPAFKNIRKNLKHVFCIFIWSLSSHIFISQTEFWDFLWLLKQD